MAAASGGWFFLLLIRFDMSAQALDDRFFLPFLDFLLHLFESEVHDVVMMKLLRRENVAEAEP